MCAATRPPPSGRKRPPKMTDIELLVNLYRELSPNPRAMRLWQESAFRLMSRGHLLNTIFKLVCQ